MVYVYYSVLVFYHTSFISVVPCTIPSCTSCSTSEVCSSCEEGLVTDRDGSACASPIPITSGELSIGIIFG